MSSFHLEKRETPLRILSTSDWHLGHRRVSALNICNRLRQYLFPYLSQIDLLNLGGDIWDSLLTLCDDTNVIEALLIDLLRLCDEHKVIVRVLLGTYSHDRTQSSLFPILQDRCHFSNDLKYIDHVHLEEIKALNIRILYLPDDLPYDSAHDCMQSVAEMMVVRNWDYVDYVFGHGYFDHMLPTHIPRKPKVTFHVDQFKNIVRRYVCMGHIHMCDYTGNVFYNNSFDRLAHGEEDPKGFMMIYDHGDVAKLEFIENKSATKFITFDLSMYNDQDQIGKVYLERLKDVFGDDPGHIRIIHPSVEIRQALHRLTSNHYPKLFYSFVKPKHHKTTDVHETHRKILNVKNYPVPSEENLPDLVYQFLNHDQESLTSYERFSELLKTL